MQSDILRPRLDSRLCTRYLGVLGVSKRPPSLDALTELVAAHLTRVPFENVSKLYYRKHMGLRDIPDLPTWLDGIERYHFGGTCYSNNFYLYQLLVQLGYTVKLCGADMSSHDVHIVSMVAVEGREYIVDGGYAAPFLAPLPRDLPHDHVIAHGRDRYALKPQDATGCSQLELYRDGVLKHGYLAKPAPRQIKDFHQVIVDSYDPSATFMNTLLLTRFYPGRSFVIHNLTLIESDDARTTLRTLSGRMELARVVQEYFGIPRDLVMDVVIELGQLRDAWS